MNRVVVGVLLAVSLLATRPPAARAASAQVPLAVTVLNASLQLFPTEAAAQAHCPKDEVVWLNTGSGVYHEKGMRWYGNTKHGAYVCRKEADAAGDRDTRNGQ